MGRLTLTAVWLASVAPLALEATEALSLGGASRLGLALLPWLAAAGLPKIESARSTDATESPDRESVGFSPSDPTPTGAPTVNPRAGGPGGGAAARARANDDGVPPWVVLAAALPPCLLAARLDVAGGAPLSRIAWLAAAGLALVAGLAFAARVARGGAPHALVWLALVPAPPLLALALGWAARPGAGVAPLGARWLAESGPLGWVLGWTRAAGSPALAEAEWPVGAVAVTAVLVLVGVLGAARAPRGAS